MVIDPTGAAVPGAAITVVNQDTGFKRRGTTSASGVFSAPDLLPGTYRVLAESNGFGPQERQGVALDANHVEHRLPLTVGTTSTQIDVKAAPVINTETRTSSFVKVDMQLLDTALLVRQSNSNQGFAIYNPGVGVNDSGNYYASGAARSTVHRTNDGIVEMQDLTGSGGGPITPDVESVAEMNFDSRNAPGRIQEREFRHHGEQNPHEFLARQRLL